MKKIYVIRGISGSGKSSLLASLNLESHTLSMDTFREIYSGVDYSYDGKIGISQDDNSMIAEMFKNALIFKMKKGATICVDNLNISSTDINGISKIAKPYNYEVTVVNFDLQKLDWYIERNSKRPERKQLSKGSLLNQYNKFLNSNIEECNVKFISVDEFIKEQSLNSLDFKTNLDGYEKINHIGSIYGDGELLNKIIMDMKENEFYIFLGNYLNYGQTPDRVIDSLKTIFNKDNVVFLKGDLDNTLYYVGQGLESKDEHFHNNTFYKINDETDFIKDFYKSLNSYFVYSYKDKNVFVSNSGVPDFVEKPFLINDSVFTSFNRYYTLNINEKFDKETNENFFQVNNTSYFKSFVDPKSKDRSFSLYNESFIGENLIQCILDNNGFTFKKIEVPTFNLELKKQKICEVFKMKNYIPLLDINDLNIENTNGLSILEKDGSTISVIDDNIVSISKKENNFHAKIIFSEKEIYQSYIDKKTGDINILNSKFQKIIPDVNIDPYVANIMKDQDLLCSYYIENNEFKLIDLYRKDINKTSYEINPKIIKKSNPFIYFKSDEGLNGFLKSVKEGKKENKYNDMFILYNDGKIKKISLKDKNKIKKEL